MGNPLYSLRIPSARTSNAVFWWRGCLLLPWIRLWPMVCAVKWDDITHWGRDKVAAICQTTFSNASYWMEMYIFRFKFFPSGPIDNIPVLAKIMTWRRPGDMPLSEPMMANLLTHICVTWPQWVKTHVTSPYELFWNQLSPIKNKTITVTS